MRAFLLLAVLIGGCVGAAPPAELPTATAPAVPEDHALPAEVGLPDCMSTAGPAGSAPRPYLPIADREQVFTMAGSKLDLGGLMPAAHVPLQRPEVLSLAADGTLFIADPAGNSVWRIGSDGLASRLAGTGSAESVSPGGSRLGDGGPANEAPVRFPRDVEAQPDGGALIADTNHYVVRLVDANGTIERVAGSRNFAYGGDGGAAVEAGLGYPLSATLDVQGDIYIADAGENNPDPGAGNRVRRVRDGMIETVLGGPRGGLSDAVPRDRLPGLREVEAAPDGSIVVRLAAPDRAELLRFDPTTMEVERIAGSEGVTAFAHDPSGRLVMLVRGQLLGESVGEWERLPIAIPTGLDIGGMDVDENMRVFVSDAANRVVLLFAPNKPVEVYAGGGDNVKFDGPAAQARLRDSQGMAYDARGNLYFSDFQGNSIRRLSTRGLVETVAGTGGTGSTGDGGHPLNATFQQPRALVFDAGGRLFFIDETGGGGLVRMITPGADGEIDGSLDECILTVAGRLAPRDTADRGAKDGGPATDAVFLGARGLVFRSDGALLVADWLDHRIRVITPGPSGLLYGDRLETIATFAGTGLETGVGAVASPNWLSVDASDRVYYYSVGKEGRPGAIQRLDADGSFAPVIVDNNVTSFQTVPGGGLLYATGSGLVHVDANATATVIAGGEELGDADGPPSHARFRGAGFFALMPNDSGVAVFDSGNGRIRYVPLVAS